MRTAIVVGAGASAELNLPVGNKLTGIIADRLNFKIERGSRTSGSDDIYCALQHGKAQSDPRCSDFNSLMRAARMIQAAMPLAPSIDNFIHTHNENKAIELVGKLAIAESILEAERHSKIYFQPGKRDSQVDFAQLKDTWFNAFSQRLMEYGTIDDLRRRLADITFIIFNYDRCIEHYLFHAFKTYYDNLSPEDAGGLVNSIQIFHPYGSVGSLPWIQNGSETVSFGESCDPRKLFGLAGEIRTFTEGTDLQSSHVAGLRQSLEDADQVVFLGFHFHKLNLDLLRPRTAATPKSSQTYKVFATAKNFKGEDRDAIRNDISKRFAGHVRSFFIDDCTCAELFDRNKVTLAFD